MTSKSMRKRAAIGGRSEVGRAEDGMRTDREGWSESRCEDVMVVEVVVERTMERRAASSGDAPRIVVVR